MTDVGTALGGRLLTTRWFVRSPVPIYQLGFGWMFGSRFLMLEHRGRVSARPRHVVLECVLRPDPATLFVASGFGDKAQWYRNVLADPGVRVSIGRRRNVPGVATPLTDVDSVRVLDEYGELHPKALKQLTDVVHAAHPDREVDIRVVRLDLAGATRNSDAR